MEEIIIPAEKRDITGKKVKRLRKEGKLPGVVYGGGIEPTPITMDYKSAAKILEGATSSDLVRIDVGGEEYPTLVRERQRDYILGTLLHVDFQVVSLTEIVKASVSIEYIGESPAVKSMNGVLVSGLEAIEVEGLPQELPSSIEVDVSVLEDYGDSILVGDLQFPAGITILNKPEETVVLVTGKELLPEEEEEELEEELEEGEEPEVIEKGRREEEEESEE